MKTFIKNNSLSLAFILLFFIALGGQIYCGEQEHNKELHENGQPSITLQSYLVSGHSMEAIFENWESEFLQMALFVVLTIFLQQKGSSESKDFNKKEEVDREPSPKRKNAPWPVRKGGWILAIYSYSLSIAFTLLFVISFVLHLYGSLKDENEQLLMKSKPPVTALTYLGDTRFWFESFQNWQSEFLSVFAIVILSIYLRQKGSPQSKPVDAPNMETGE
jgi:preprotein translocase subunit SecG